eukprot:scaffold3774_cov137-Alexandrium_tamarense.AAC.8
MYDEQPSITDIIDIVFLLCIFWFVLFSIIINSILRPLVYNKPWLVRSAKKMLKDLNINMMKEEAIAWSMGDWPRMQSLYLQRFVGSLLKRTKKRWKDVINIRNNSQRTTKRTKMHFPA